MMVGRKEGNHVRAAGNRTGRSDSRIIIIIIIIIIMFPRGPSFVASSSTAALSQRKPASTETSRGSCRVQGHVERYAL
jgi:hypothetical protein